MDSEVAHWIIIALLIAVILIMLVVPRYRR